MSSTFADIKTKVRKVTGRPSTNQLTEAELENYINDYLVYELPENIRLFTLRQTYNLTLSPNVGNYALTAAERNAYLSYEPPAYVDGYQIQYFQDEQAFFQKFSQLKYSVQIATGDGTPGPYTGTYSYTPIQPTTAIISTLNAGGGSLTCSDTAAGALTGDVIAGGTLNHTTGAVAGLTWTAAVPAGNAIYMSALRYVTGRPIAVLFYANVFFFWPWPDRAYSFDIVAYANPSTLTLDTESPELNEWVDLIAYGASMKIFADNLDMESYAKVKVFYDEYQRLAERRTLKQLSTQRAATIYGDANGYPWQGSYPYS